MGHCPCLLCVLLSGCVYSDIQRNPMPDGQTTLTVCDFMGAGTAVDFNGKLVPNTYGCVQYDLATNECLIVYKDSLPYLQKKEVINHEIKHCLNWIRG